MSGASLLVECKLLVRDECNKSNWTQCCRLLDASLGATSSPDCSVKMAYILTNVSWLLAALYKLSIKYHTFHEPLKFSSCGHFKVALTCMAKLRDERFVCPTGADSDAVTCLDIISAKQLSNAACNSLLFKLIMAIMRNESSETLRRR